MSPAELWSEKYAARFEALRALERQVRTEAFLDLPREICGVPVHLMTPHHLHLLEGSGNALVCGGNPAPAEYAAFVWVLHTRNSGRNSFADAFRRGRMLRTLGHTPTERVALECESYLEQVFLDAEAPSSAAEQREAETRPFGGWFLLPMLSLLVAEFGAIEPFSGRAWGRVPLPVCFQYRKLARARLSKGEYIDRSPSDKLLSDFAAELNT